MAKAPQWIQSALLLQLQRLDDPISYIQILKNASIQETDEIAFIIAHSPVNTLPPADLIQQTIYWLYEIDSYLNYADIIDYTNENGSYYSTVRYQVLENNTQKEYEYPPSLYYWYIVHPRLLNEQAEYIYDSFWREYLFFHNDIGYPLLQEKIENISYLWDGSSYHQDAQRIWSSCIAAHPTAIEAVSYWIGKTVPFEAAGDRPNQPNIIAHQHNGYCGELQRLAIAAMRALLIPTIGECNIAEDHVWRAFYHQGWHQNDNWWADTGGTVDTPYVYTDGWGKDMSAIYTWRGDGVIFESTPTYLHQEDMVTIDFHVQDLYRKPYDGARVTVLVTGLKDISWYTYQLSELIDTLWEKIPLVLKHTILEKIFHKIQEKISSIPEVIDGVTTTIWGYTDTNGSCEFQLGKNDSYVFMIQKPSQQAPWPFSQINRFRVLNHTISSSYQIYFPSMKQPPVNLDAQQSTTGEMQSIIDVTSECIQEQQNIRSYEIGQTQLNGAFELLVVNEENYQRYLNHQSVQYISFEKEKTTKLTIQTPDQSLYYIFRNPYYNTNLHLLVNLTISKQTNEDHVFFSLSTPSLFETPLFQIGNKITLNGYSSNITHLKVYTEHITRPEGQWSYTWDTLHATPGLYEVIGTCGTKEHQMSIELIDVVPPTLQVVIPSESILVLENTSILQIKGTSSDEAQVSHVFISLDNQEPIQAKGTIQWTCNLSPSDLKIGPHTISINAVDSSGNKMETKRTLILTDTSSQLPSIDDLTHHPEVIENTSNVIIYAFVNQTGVVPIQTVSLHLQIADDHRVYPMYLYGSCPIQTRHLEDPFINISNTPRYGRELGQFPINTTVKYWIEVHDYAGNTISSGKQEFTVL